MKELLFDIPLGLQNFTSTGSAEVEMLVQHKGIA